MRIFLNRIFLSLGFFAILTVTSCARPGDFTVSKAMQAYQAQSYDKSLELFNQALNEDLSYSKESIYTMIANVYLAQQDLENAIVFQEKSLELKEDYRTYVTLGMNYHLLKNDEKAEEAYQKAVKLNPEKAEALVSLGSLYLGMEKYEEAVTYFLKSIEKESRIAIAHANLALAYAFTDEFEKADQELKIAEELKCENIEDFKERVSSLAENNKK